MKKSLFLFIFLAVILQFYFLCKIKKGLMYKKSENTSFDELSITNNL